MNTFCTNCGHKLTEGIKFCTSCGKPILAVQAASVPKEVPNAPKPENKPAPQNPVTQNTQQSLNVNPVKTPPVLTAPLVKKEKRKLSKREKIYIVLLVMVLGLGYTGYYLFLQHHPGWDAKKAAQAYGDYRQKDGDLYLKKYTDFTTHFDSYTFKSADEAMQKLNERDTGIEALSKSVTEQHDNLRALYLNDPEKLTAFDSTYNSIISAWTSYKTQDAYNAHAKAEDKINSAFKPKQEVVSKSFSGNVGNLKASYSLAWNQDGTITGSYFYPDRPNVTYVLQGKDLGNDNIQLTEYTGSQISANCNLTLQGNCYTGIMNNTDGRQLNMTMCPSSETISPVTSQNSSLASVKAAQTHFYDSPNGNKSAIFIVYGDEINISQDENGFVNAEFTGANGKITKGWLNKNDLSFSFPGRFPQASQKQLSDAEINMISKNDLKIMRNEIYARHGYIFNTPDMISYFGQQSWYQARFKIANLTPLEKQNVELIKKYE